MRGEVKGCGHEMRFGAKERPTPAQTARTGAPRCSRLHLLTRGLVRRNLRRSRSSELAPKGYMAMSNEQWQEGKPHDPFFHEVAIFQQLIKERSSPFDLARELLSNSAAREVGAENISVKYSNTLMTDTPSRLLTMAAGWVTPAISKTPDDSTGF